MTHIWTGAGWRHKLPTAKTAGHANPAAPGRAAASKLPTNPVVLTSRMASAIEAAQEVLDAKQSSPGARRTAERILGVLTGQDLTSASRLEGDVA